MAKKILVIDDEPVILLGVSDRMRLEGYEVVTAQDGKSGIEQAEKEKPDIIILDIMLPDMTGHEVCKAIKSKVGNKCFVIMATSKIDAVDAKKARDSGADDFTVKTTDYGPLLGAVKQRLP